MSTPTRAILDKILGATVRAPSGDNVQPARFEVSADFAQIDMFNVPERDPSYFNYLQLASYVAHGAMIENFIIAAKAYGYAAELTLFPSVSDENHTARFVLKATEIEKGPLFEAIFQRCTNRNVYSSGPFSAEQKQLIFRAVEGIDGVSLSVVDDREEKNRLAKSLAVNDRMVFEHKAIHQFLFSKIRWTAAEVNATRDGMPIETLGLNPIEKLFFPLMRFWTFVKGANLIGLSRVIGLKGWVGCRSAMALGMVTTELSGKEDFLASGRAFQRVWLEATRQGMAFQPVTGITFLMQRLCDGQLTGFTAKQRKLIGLAEIAMREAFKAGDHVMAVGFRVGYDDAAPEVKTKRLEPLVLIKPVEP